MFGKARPLKAEPFRWKIVAEVLVKPRWRLLFESDAYSLFVAPDDVTVPLEMLRRNTKD
jgi:hypothetical protein